MNTSTLTLAPQPSAPQITPDEFEIVLMIRATDEHFKLWLSRMLSNEYGRCMAEQRPALRLVNAFGGQP